MIFLSENILKYKINVFEVTDMKELKLEELSVRQKLGMCLSLFSYGASGVDDENFQYALQLIREHSLGAFWLTPNNGDFEKMQAKILETADYPILMMTDAESGIGEYRVGEANAIASTGNEELAYTFGKVCAVTARKMGYNVVCNPVVDMCAEDAVCGGVVRSLGGDKEKVARMAAAVARGARDGGVLTVAKHYPSATDPMIDSHMEENRSMVTKEELLDYNLYPYLYLMKENVLDGIMVGHSRLPNIDPDYPASLSKKVNNVIREQGFDGFLVTDALEMMGVVAKFGRQGCKGLSIAGGCDLALVSGSNRESLEALVESYEKGLIDDERLNEAARHVLEAQHKVMLGNQNPMLTEEDLEKFDRINRDSTFARTDPQVPVALDRNGRYLFVVLKENPMLQEADGKVFVDTMGVKWYKPKQIMEQLKELFPNSGVETIYEFPRPIQNLNIMDAALKYDEVVFISFVTTQTCVGKECLTDRILTLLRGLKTAGKLSTIVHFGNPFALESTPHVERLLIGNTSEKNVAYTMEILAGKYPAKGVLPYPVKLP